MSEPAEDILVLCSKCVVSSAMGTQHQPLRGNHSKDKWLVKIRYKYKMKCYLAIKKIKKQEICRKSGWSSKNIQTKQNKTKLYWVRWPRKTSTTCFLSHSQFLAPNPQICVWSMDRPHKPGKNKGIIAIKDRNLRREWQDIGDMKRGTDKWAIAPTEKEAGRWEQKDKEEWGINNSKVAWLSHKESYHFTCC